MNNNLEIHAVDIQSPIALFTCGPFYWHGLTSIPAWISNPMPSKVWYEINHSFLNFNGCTDEVWEWISDVIQRLIMDAITYPCWDER